MRAEGDNILLMRWDWSRKLWSGESVKRGIRNNCYTRHAPGARRK